MSFLHFSPLWTTTFGTLKKTIFLFTSRTIGAAVNYTKHRHLDFFTRQFYGQTSLPAIHLNLALSRCSAVTSRETKLFHVDRDVQKKRARIHAYAHFDTSEFILMLCVGPSPDTRLPTLGRSLLVRFHSRVPFWRPP